MPQSWENRAGKAFLAKREEIILRVGTDEFSRRRMVEELKCGNFTAARILNRVLWSFKPKNVRDLAKKMDIDDLMSIPGVGQASAWVWLCVMDSVGIDVELWYHTPRKILSIKQKNKPVFKTRRIA